MQEKRDTRKIVSIGLLVLAAASSSHVQINVVNINQPAMTNLGGTELDGVITTANGAGFAFLAPVNPGLNTVTFILSDSRDNHFDTTVYIQNFGVPAPQRSRSPRPRRHLRQPPQLTHTKLGPHKARVVFMPGLFLQPHPPPHYSATSHSRSTTSCAPITYRIGVIMVMAATIAIKYIF